MRTKANTNGLWAALPLALLMSAISCGASEDGSGDSARTGGASCSKDAQCVSGVCTSGKCVGNGSGAPAGSDCTGNAQCASGRCTAGQCSVGRELTDGSSCVVNTECRAGVCSDGVCGTAPKDSDDSSGDPSSSSSSTGTDSTSGPQFTGGGDSSRPLGTGCGPETANQCTGECERSGGDPDVEVVRPPALLCFSGEPDLAPEDPSAAIEQTVERRNGQEYVHIRISFDPTFTDVTYGTGACCGWPVPDETTTEEPTDAKPAPGGRPAGGKKGHTFEDLVGSDHVELLLTDGNSNTVMDFKLDLIHESEDAACGYKTLGVSGGDGKMITGDSAYILAAATSISRNLDGCGYCAAAACDGDCTLNSPATDESYTPNPETPNWDYRQVYEVWVDTAAFGDAGYGQAFITQVHSSPAKTDSTVPVEPSPCPPGWDSPYCTPGSSGCPDAGSPPSGGDGDDACSRNEQPYDTGSGTICTPIPFSNNPGMAACPEGYVLDVASEGRYCLPE